MQRLVFIDQATREREEELARVRPLIEAARTMGYEVSPEDARKAWEAFSDSMAAGWMSMEGYSPAELFYTMKSHLREVDETT